MIKKKIEDAFNKQIQAEIYSAHIYLAMSAYFEDKNLSGFANWMRVQYSEEIAHAMKFYNHVVERGGRVELLAIAKPPATWKSPLDAFKAAYSHEVKVTGMIHNLVDLAKKEKDHASMGMLQWFVDEQIEEEDSTDTIVQKLKMVGNSSQGLLMIDRELSARKAEPEENGGG